LDELPIHERRAVRFYTPVLVIGTLVALGIFAAYGAPLLVQTVWKATSSLQRGIAQGQLLPLLDGLAVLAIIVFFQALFVVTFLKTHRAASPAQPVDEQLRKQVRL
jgi:hypothetical protein